MFILVPLVHLLKEFPELSPTKHVLEKYRTIHYRKGNVVDRLIGICIGEKNTEQFITKKEMRQIVSLVFALARKIQNNSLPKRKCGRSSYWYLHWWIESINWRMRWLSSGRSGRFCFFSLRLIFFHSGFLGRLRLETVGTKDVNFLFHSSAPIFL